MYLKDIHFVAMGTWGTGIFSSDTAQDVREEYRALLAEGMMGSDATKKLLVEWKSTIDDPDEAPDFWLALVDWLGRVRQASEENSA